MGHARSAIPVQQRRSAAHQGAARSRAEDADSPKPQRRIEGLEESVNVQKPT
jgi:hypothetical protein